jgi:hypothetical protein
LINCETGFAIEDSRASQRADARLGRREGSLSSPQGVFEAAKLPQKRYEALRGDNLRMDGDFDLGTDYLQER